MGNQAADATKRPDLERRLAPRRAVEAKHQRGRKAYGRGDFMLAHDRVTGFVLRAILWGAGLYQRGLANALRVELRHLRLEFTDLPPALNGFRILHLADLHIDGVEGLVEILADKIPGLPVDLCVLTGDYRFEVYGPSDRVYPRMRQSLSVVHARYGVVGILGNHDCADIAVELENAGVRMLINEAIAVGPETSRLWIIGVDDPHYYGCDDLTQALEAVPTDAFRLLLAHTPEMFQEAAKAGIHLYLTGHTHGGQICVPWIGPLIMNAACPRVYTHGHWQHGGMQGYTGVHQLGRRLLHAAGPIPQPAGNYGHRACPNPEVIPTPLVPTFGLRQHGTEHTSYPVLQFGIGHEQLAVLA